MPKKTLNMITPVNWFHPLNKGLEAWWKILPGIRGGRLREITGRIKISTLTNMTRSNWKGPTGRTGGFGSLDYNGTAFVNAPAPDAPFVGPITISVWARIDTGSAFRHFAGKHAGGGGTNNPFDFRTNNSATPGLVLVRASASVSRVWVGPNTTLGIWQNIVVTCADNLIETPPEFYINGIPTTGTGGVNTGVVAGSEADIRIGRRADGVVQMDGRMDDLRIHSRGLSPEEVIDLFHESKQRFTNLHNWIQSPVTFSLPTGFIPIQRKRIIHEFSHSRT